MPLFFLLGLGAVFLYIWISRRRFSLTRLCLWRLDRTVGPGHFGSAACGAICDLPVGAEPRHCLNPRRIA
jgi:hypothetical protein